MLRTSCAETGSYVYYVYYYALYPKVKLLCQKLLIKLDCPYAEYSNHAVMD